MRRVAHLLFDANLTGGQVFALRLGEALRKHGWESTYVLPEEGPLLELLARSNFESAVVSTTGSPFRTALSLCQYLRAAPPDVIHSHLVLPTQFAARLAAVSQGLPLISHYHTAPTLPRDHVLRAAYSAVDRWGANYLSATNIAVSAALAESLAGFGIRNLLTVPNGVPIPKHLRPEPADKCVLILGRVARVKGHDIALRALAQLPSNAVDRCRIVGESLTSDDRQFQTSLRQLARELGLADRVELCRATSRPELHLNDAWCLVFPSRSGEGMPLVILEAMAAGVPVLGARLSGVPELIDDGVTGLLFEPEDTGGLAHALARLSAEPGLATKLAGTARARAEAAFSIEITARRVSDIYSCYAPTSSGSHRLSRSVSRASGGPPQPRSRGRLDLADRRPEPAIGDTQYGKVAVACSGVGLTWRGFERFSVELATCLSVHTSVVLLSSGPSGLKIGQRLPSLRRTRLGVLRHLPPRSRRWNNCAERDIYVELESFCASLLFWLVLHPVDVVFCSEPLVARRLFQAKKVLRFLRYQVVYVDGLGLAPAHLAKAADVVQVMSPGRLEELVAADQRPGATVQIPYGVNTAEYKRTARSKLEARLLLGLPAGGAYLLSVAAINRPHKRIDYLTREVAAADFEGTLLLCGAAEDPSVLHDAAGILGKRVVHLYVEPHMMPTVYAASDFFVVTSLVEGFCLAAVEAMASGLRVIAHDSPYFRWLLGEVGIFAPMDQEGALAAALRSLGSVPSRATRPEAEAERYSWNTVMPEYLRLLHYLGNRKAATILGSGSG